jgi:hypothetical protein
MRSRDSKSLSWEEYELLKYELYRLSNDLTDYEIRLRDHDLLVSKMHSIRHEINDLIGLLRVEKVIS